MRPGVGKRRSPWSLKIVFNWWVLVLFHTIFEHFPWLHGRMADFSWIVRVTLAVSHWFPKFLIFFFSKHQINTEIRRSRSAWVKPDSWRVNLPDFNGMLHDLKAEFVRTFKAPPWGFGGWGPCDTIRTISYVLPEARCSVGGEVTLMWHSRSDRQFKR